VVWNIKVHSAATWITVYWSRPLNAPYLDYAVEYVLTVNRKLMLSGKYFKVCVSAIG